MSGFHNNIFQNCYKESDNDIKRYDDNQNTPNVFKQTSKKNQQVEEFKYKDIKSSSEKPGKDENPYYGLSEGMITFGKNPLLGAANHAESNEIPIKEVIDQNSLKQNASFKRKKATANINPEPTSVNNQNPNLNQIAKSNKSNSVTKIIKRRRVNKIF